MRGAGTAYMLRKCFQNAPAISRIYAIAGYEKILTIYRAVIDLRHFSAGGISFVSQAQKL
ncbi:protein of unknown function [Desulfovibrio sp. 86]|nr:protein of unknown function [Desulfovibrio sp. 86]